MTDRSGHTLLMLGDSLVEWGSWEQLLPEIAVLNRGRAGETVEELSGRLGEELVRTEAADTILVMSGTNNLIMGDQTFPFVLETMLGRIHALSSASMVVLNGMFPIASPWVPAAALEAVNRQLATIARETKSTFLDPVPLFTACSGQGRGSCFQPDGIHLNAQGYQIWARAIRDILCQDEGRETGWS